VLEVGASYNVLVNAAPENLVANSAGKKRILPGNLDRSFLWNKISAQPMSSEGASMPFGANLFIALNPELTEVIRKWILAGAPKEGIVDGTSGGGGGSAQQQPPIEPLAPPAAGQGFQVKIPAFALSNQPERNRFICLDTKSTCTPAATTLLSTMAKRVTETMTTTEPRTA
jgi:hypothetical protein